VARRLPRQCADGKPRGRDRTSRRRGREPREGVRAMSGCQSALQRNRAEGPAVYKPACVPSWKRGTRSRIRAGHHGQFRAHGIRIKGDAIGRAHEVATNRLHSTRATSRCLRPKGLDEVRLQARASRRSMKADCVLQRPASVTNELDCRTTSRILEIYSTAVHQTLKVEPDARDVPPEGDRSRVRPEPLRGDGCVLAPADLRAGRRTRRTIVLWRSRRAR